MQAAILHAPTRPRVLPWSRMGDESLASRAAAGSQAAFTALYERYYEPLLGYCRSILLDAEDARDATQSALENALRALPRRETDRPLRPWLYRIAHNEAISIVRRRQPVDDRDAAELLTVPGPEADAEQRSRLSQLVDDLRMLPERQRGALVMRELSGLSYDEIAVALGLSNDAARRAVCDARTALHDALDGRATACVSVRRSLSDGDRRHLRARGLRAHLRSCDDCATFERAMGARQRDLHLLGAWLSGSAALGLIGLGAGGTGAGTLVATGGAASGGLTWGGLPTAIKGLAVAAALATTGTAAVELPKVAAPDGPARQASIASAAISPRAGLHERALAQARADRRARARRAHAARAATGRGQSHGGAAIEVGRGRARPAPVAAATTPLASHPAAGAPNAPPARQPAPAAAKTPHQRAVEDLQRIREQILAAFQNAQTIAASGVQGALAAAASIVETTLSSTRPAIARIFASIGLSPPATPAPVPAPTTAAANPPAATVLAPAQSLLGGVDGLLHRLVQPR